MHRLQHQIIQRLSTNQWTRLTELQKWNDGLSDLCTDFCSQARLSSPNLALFLGSPRSLGIKPHAQVHSVSATLIRQVYTFLNKPSLNELSTLPLY